MIKTGPWNLSEFKSIPKNGLNVFSCFHCGGGSTMGYKLAGYNVLGGVEIDPKLMKVYRKNHNPKHSYLMGIKEFNNLSDESIPKELFELDILDGSPPCSSFSIMGAREKKWGISHKFREGQVNQILDDLFFHFIDTANKLKPKIIIAENVKGLIIGKAKGYVKEIFNQLEKIGYNTQLFLLNSYSMGVPQARERVFFISYQKTIKFPSLNLKFDEPLIGCKKAFEGLHDVQINKPLSELEKEYYYKVQPGKSFASKNSKGHYFSYCKIHPYKPCITLTAKPHLFHYEQPRRLNSQEIIRIQTFPDDYDFGDNKVGYICGMSVPPFMMQRIALQIYKQWFSQESRVD